MKIEMPEMTEDDFLSPTEFYCSHCDGAIVHPERPETGRFFYQTGHQYSWMHKTFSGWTTVVFALCTDCLQKE